MKTTPINIETYATETCLHKYVTRAINSQIYAQTQKTDYDLGINAEAIAARVFQEISEYFETNNIITQQEQSDLISEPITFEGFGRRYRYAKEEGINTISFFTKDYESEIVIDSEDFVRIAPVCVRAAMDYDNPTFTVELCKADTYARISVKSNGEHQESFYVAATNSKISSTK